MKNKIVKTKIVFDDSTELEWEGDEYAVPDIIPDFITFNFKNNQKIIINTEKMLFFEKKEVE